MGAIARLLNQREVPTRTQHCQWNRSTIWKMLHTTRLTRGGRTMAKPSFVLGSGSPDAASAWPQQRVSGTAASRLNRNPRTGCGQRSDLRSAQEQLEVLSTAHHRAILVAGTVGLSALWLWALPNLDANFQSAQSTTIAAWGGMVTALQKSGLATTAPFARIISMQ